jgi:hypothetical protein
MPQWHGLSAVPDSVISARIKIIMGIPLAVNVASGVNLAET